MQNLCVIFRFTFLKFEIIFRTLSHRSTMIVIIRVLGRKKTLRTFSIDVSYHFLSFYAYVPSKKTICLLSHPDVMVVAVIARGSISSYSGLLPIQLYTDTRFVCIKGLLYLENLKKWLIVITIRNILKHFKGIF